MPCLQGGPMQRGVLYCDMLELVSIHVLMFNLLSLLCSDLLLSVCLFLPTYVCFCFGIPAGMLETVGNYGIVFNSFQVFNVGNYGIVFNVGNPHLIIYAVL